MLLENVLNKVLLAAYALAPDTWKKVCKVESVPDFRVSPRYRVGSFKPLDNVSEGEDYKSVTVPDGVRLDISTSTKGNILAVTRQAIVNDDMSALADLSSRFGRAAGLSLETDFYALLNQNAGLGPTMADGNPFFHSSHANVNGTGAALSVAGLDADRVIMAKQKDISNNEFLGLTPSALLVPIELGNQARRLNTAPYDTDSGGKFQLPNLVLDLSETWPTRPASAGLGATCSPTPRSRRPSWWPSFRAPARRPSWSSNRGGRWTGSSGRFASMPA